MRTAEEYRMRMAQLRRDEQATWAAELFTEICAVAAECADWYCGRVGAEFPDTPLSSVVRCGEPGEKGARHRLESLAAAMGQRDTLTTADFAAFEASVREALDVLEGVRPTTQLTAARAAYEGWLAYVRRVNAQKTDERDFAARNLGLAQAFAKALDDVAAALRTLEQDLRALPPDDPYQAQQLALAQETRAGVVQLVKRARHPPASSTAVAWVEQKWAYFRAHPECLGIDVTRSRVYARHVWVKVKDEAIEKHGIADLRTFRTILNNLRQRRFRKKENPNRP